MNRKIMGIRLLVWDDLTMQILPMSKAGKRCLLVYGLACTVLVVVSFGYCIAQSSDQAALIAVLDSSLTAAHGGNYQTMDILASRARVTKDRQALYVALLDYYLGAGAGELLDELIVKEGQGILPSLDEKRKSPLDCIEKYDEICLSSVNQRNERIDYLI